MINHERKRLYRRKLRVGVIGAGWWTVTSHLPALAARQADLEFTAICGKNDRVLEQVGRQYGFETLTDDYRRLLDCELDVCIVASPPAFHYEHASSALSAGAHVLIEKPITLDSGDAWELVRLATRADLHLICSFGWNFLPPLVEAKRLLDEQSIGEIEHFAIHMASPVRSLLSGHPPVEPTGWPPPETETWASPEVSGGGYGQAQLSHALGLALWLSGLRGASVFAFMSSQDGTRVEAYDALAVRCSAGAVGTIAGGAAHNDYGNGTHDLGLRFIGSTGHFVCDMHRELISLHQTGAREVIVTVPQGGLHYNCVGPPNTLVDLALGRQVRNYAPGELGARTVEVLEAAYRSARSGNQELVNERAHERISVFSPEPGSTSRR